MFLVLIALQCAVGSTNTCSTESSYIILRSQCIFLLTRYVMLQGKYSTNVFWRPGALTIGTAILRYQSMEQIFPGNENETISIAIIVSGMERVPSVSFLFFSFSYFFSRKIVWLCKF